MSAERLERAWELLREAYNQQMEGEYDLAVDLYRQSLAAHPTAEAFTFLGWTYHFQGKIDQAIEECKRAIAVDPDFGNPYNDIGAYLIEKQQYDQAIPWLEQAITAKRYDSYNYPLYNLGRVFLAQGMLKKAQACFAKALEISPQYTLAREALEAARRKVN